METGVLQVWFNLSDKGVEDGLYDSIAMRRFAGITDEDEDVPDAMTLLKFRYLLEEHGLTKAIFEEVNRKLEETGHMLRGGTIVDATIIQAPSSAKNREKKRDSEMRSTKKNKQFGADAFSGLAHTLKTTAANAADVKVAAELLRDDDRFMYGDNGYQGVAKCPEIKKDGRLSKIDFRVNCRRRSLPKVSEKAIDWNRKIELMKSSARCIVEFPFRTAKRVFGFRKTVCCGLKKNENRLYMLFASSNLYAIARDGRTLSPAW